MIRYDKHAFLAKTEALAFHGRAGHFKGFPGTDLMGQQGIPTIDDMGDRVPLVFPENNFRVHTGKSNMAAVIFPGTDGIELLIVPLNQRFPALRVFPDPFLKSVFQCLLFLLGQGCFFLVQHPAFLAICVLYSIVDPDIPQIQRVFQNPQGVCPVSSIGYIDRDIAVGRYIFPVDMPFRGIF